MLQATERTVTVFPISSSGEPPGCTVTVKFQPDIMLGQFNGLVEKAAELKGCHFKLYKVRFDRQIGIKTPVPSTGIIPHKFREHQDGPNPLYNGRYGAKKANLKAAPVQIYHPTFTAFLAYRKDATEIPTDIIITTRDLMKSLSEVVEKEAHCMQTRALLSSLLGHLLIEIKNSNRTIADHIGTLSLGVFVIVEEKLDMGKSGDAVTQGSFSWLAWFKDDDRKTLLHNIFAPCFTIAVSGPWIAISGAIFATHAVIQTLTDYISLSDSHILDEEYVTEIARMFYALQRAVAMLREHYETVQEVKLECPPRDVETRFFPMATSYFKDGVEVRFRYLRRLGEQGPRCVTFLVELEQSKSKSDDKQKRFVVKFVDHYSCKAHKLLTASNMAPKLEYYGSIWSEMQVPNSSLLPHKMVVMEYIDGRTAFDLFHGETVPKGVQDAVTKALGCLHKEGLVHGDIRRKNILIENPGDTVNYLLRTKIVNFDRAGEEQKVTFLPSVNDRLWPEGVRELDKILYIHDISMAKLTFSDKSG
ncbi:hypothetical protein V8D89_015839 [Ganoderma adspersum]